MDPNDYERYVETVVRNLDFGGNATVSKNAMLRGVRQPGDYEIDILVKITLDEKLQFVLLVECKNWSRRVDRPVIQKLVQTRDAVAAHKAAVASPLGFSREAIDVARANGVALWVLSKTTWTVVLGAGPPTEARTGHLQRLESLRQLGLFSERRDVLLSEDLSLVGVEDASPTGSIAWREAFTHAAVRYAGTVHGDNESGIDPRLAALDVVEDCARLLEK